MIPPRVPLLLALLGACASTPRPAGSALPVHTYRVPADVGRLVIDATAFTELARPLRADVEADLARPELRDPAVIKEHLFILALLDALEDRFPASLGRIDRIAALETQPGPKVMTGLTIRVWADARTHGGDDPEAFRGALERKLVSMPIDLVRSDLSMLRTMGRVFSPEVCRRLVDQAVGSQIKDGAISLEQAQTVAFQRYAVVRLVPVGRVIDEVLGAYGIEPRSD
jgi:hypothetical protein